MLEALMTSQFLSAIDMAHSRTFWLVIRPEQSITSVAHWKLM